MRSIISVSAVVLVFFAAPSAQTSKTTGLDTTAIDRALGRSGQAMPGDVYRVAFPRTDLSVTVGGVKVKAGFATADGNETVA